MSNGADKKIVDIWTEEDHEKLTCPVCARPLYPPHQVVCCGRRICEECCKNLKETKCVCPLCSSPDLEDFPDPGHKRDVDKNEINCFVCGSNWKGFLKDLTEHLKIHNTQWCKPCHQGFVNEKQLESHKRYRCIHRTISCILTEYGCSKEISSSDISTHRLSKQHQNALMVAVEHLCLLSNSAYSDSAVRKRIQEEEEEGKQFLEECDRRIRVIMEDILLLNANRTDLDSKRQVLETKFSELREHLKGFNELFADIFKIIESIQQIFNEMFKLNKHIQEKRNTSAHTIDVNNTYVLKIALLVMLNDGSPPVNSGPIQTATFGYRFAMIVTSKMHEHSKTPFMHVSWVICQGEFDPILTWPFPYPIKISLMDLSGEQKHISHLINPDSNPQSSIFQNPKSATNLPYEIAQFCTMDKLVRNNSKFVRDGNIFIELQVDFNED